MPQRFAHRVGSRYGGIGRFDQFARLLPEHVAGCPDIHGNTLGRRNQVAGLILQTFVDGLGAIGHVIRGFGQGLGLPCQRSLDLV